jgi:hypothetical protein
LYSSVKLFGIDLGIFVVFLTRIAFGQTEDGSAVSVSVSALR